MNLSIEQQNIIDAIDTHNVCVNSVAGCGKTTTSLYMASKYKSLNFLLLTYNSRLRLETKEKALNLKIKNVECHTFHSFAVKNLDTSAHDDVAMNRALNCSKSKDYRYDIIIVDEAQDLTPLYHRLIKHIFTNNTKDYKICIIGDINQSIYNFIGSDARFLSLAPVIYINKYPWKSMTLSSSFRCTNSMTDFINNCLLDKPRIFSNKQSIHKNNYVICDVFCGQADKSKPYKIYMEYINMGYAPGDIYVLAKSVKNQRAPAVILENIIKSQNPNIMVYIPSSDNEQLSDKITNGKTLFSSFHQSKGSERKVCIVYGFDDFFYKDDKTLPNELYVALTRACESVTVIHHHKKNYLPFMKNSKELSKYFKIHGSPNIANTETIKNNIPSVTSMCRFITFDTLNNIRDIITKNKVPIKGDAIQIPYEIQIKCSKNNYETTSDIIGNAIPMFYQRFANKRKLGDNCSDGYKISAPFIKEVINKLCRYTTENKGDKYIVPQYRLTQLDNYDIIKDSDLIKACNRLILNIGKPSKDCEFEKSIKHESLVGHIDYIDKNIIYEFKCTSSIQDEHFIQLMLYNYINISNQLSSIHDINNNKQYNKDSYIVNIHNNNVYKISCLRKDNKVNMRCCNTLNLLKNININNDYYIIKNYDEYTRVFNLKYKLYYVLLNVMYDVSVPVINDLYKIYKLVNSKTDTIIDSQFIEQYKCDIIYKKKVLSLKNNIIHLKPTLKQTKINISHSSLSNICPITSNNMFNGNVCVLDIETSTYNNYIVEIGYYICDEKLNIVENRRLLINNGDGIVDFFNKLTYEEIKADGITPMEAMTILNNDLLKCKYIVGHNIKSFDLAKIIGCCNIINFDIQITHLTIIDTMHATKHIIGLLNKISRIKPPKLSELCKYCKVIPTNQHTALGDVEATHKCLISICTNPKNLAIIRTSYIAAIDIFRKYSSNSTQYSGSITINSNTEYSKNRLRGIFFPYVNKTKFDLTRYGVYDEFKSTNYENNCLFNALVNANLPDIKKSKLKTMIREMHIPLIKLKDIANELKIRIRLYRYHGEHERHTIHGDGNHDIYNIALYESHYFTYDNILLTEFALKNYALVKDLDRAHMIIGFNSKGYASRKRGKYMTSLRVLKLMVENRESGELLDTITDVDTLSQLGFI